MSSDMGKYIAYKVNPDGSQGEALEPGSFFLVRAQDAFGAAMIFNYSHLVQTFLEVDRERHFFDSDETDHLNALVDTLHETAMKWKLEYPTKIPD